MFKNLEELRAYRKECQSILQTEKHKDTHTIHN